MKLQVSVDGVPNIESAAKYVKKAVAGALETICLNGAVPIENEAKLLAPVKSGTLRRSIHHVLTTSTETACNIAIGPDTPYARRIEFGFVGADSLGRRYHQAAHPYMRPAFDSKRDESRKEMKAAAADIIQEAVVDAAASGANRGRR
jgi:HK97 gp10 family phage protein